MSMKKLKIVCPLCGKINRPSIKVWKDDDEISLVVFAVHECCKIV